MNEYRRMKSMDDYEEHNAKQTKNVVKWSMLPFMESLKTLKAKKDIACKYKARMQTQISAQGLFLGREKMIGFERGADRTFMSKFTLFLN